MRHVDHAEEVQRLVELDQIGVHHDELADGHAAVAHAGRRQQHDQGQADGDDRRLAQVQHVQRHLDADRGALVAGEGMVVALRLMLLVAEILHRFVVDQAVQRLGGGIVVGVVHGPAVAAAAAGQHRGEADIDHHREAGDDGIAPVEHVPDDGGDHHQFQRRRHDVEHGEAQHRLHAQHAAVDHPGQAAGLAVEVKAQADRVQVAEGAQRQQPHRALLDRGEQRVADFPEAGRADADRRRRPGSGRPGRRTPPPRRPLAPGSRRCGRRSPAHRRWRPWTAP